MKITKWDDDRITFDDGSYISYDHNQDVANIITPTFLC